MTHERGPSGSRSAGRRRTRGWSTRSPHWRWPDKAVVQARRSASSESRRRDSYDGALQRYVADLGLERAVTFTGYATDATVAAAYTKRRRPRRHLRARGLRRPRGRGDGSRLAGRRLRRGSGARSPRRRAGSSSPTRDPYALADAIGSLLADPARRATLAEAGRRRFAELDLPNAADRFVDLLVTVRRKPQVGADECDPSIRPDVAS